jgi:hypothetical protein
MSYCISERVGYGRQAGYSYVGRMNSFHILPNLNEVMTDKNDSRLRRAQIMITGGWPSGSKW